MLVLNVLNTRLSLESFERDFSVFALQLPVTPRSFRVFVALDSELLGRIADVQIRAPELSAVYRHEYRSNRRGRSHGREISRFAVRSCVREFAAARAG